MEESMIVTRLMDLVVLVAEMSQKSNKSFKELDKELVHLGYSSEEIEQAMFWFSSQWSPVGLTESARSGRPAFRVLSPWEVTCLNADAHGYLLRLQNLGIIDEERFENIMGRILPFGGDQFDISDVKALAGAVIFNINPDLADDELFQILNEEVAIS
jgi:uncharacterized protein Smg (DUF494 family)